MKRVNERGGNGHTGYHSITSGGSITTNSSTGSSSIGSHDGSQHSFQHRSHRPSSGHSQGNSADFLLNFLHCGPQQSTTAADSQIVHHRRGYQLLTAPPNFPAQYHTAYNYYDFPKFAASTGVSGNQNSQHQSVPAGVHGSFPSTVGSLNLRSVFSCPATEPSYNASASAVNSVSSALNTSSTTTASNSVSTSGDFFGISRDDQKTLQKDVKTGDMTNHSNGGVLNESMTPHDSNGLPIKQPKLEPVSVATSDRPGGRQDETGDGNDATAGFCSILTAPARVSRRGGGSGGRGSRGSGNHGCPYCPKKFPDAHEAETHQQMCVQQRPFDCTHCGKRFRQKTSLVQHLRIHTDTRPYQCRFCVRNFKQKSHLDQHERIHTGIKPYVCKFCNKAFRQKSGQASHELTHTNAMVQQYRVKKEETEDPAEDESEVEGEEDVDTNGDDASYCEQQSGSRERMNDTGVFHGPTDTNSSLYAV